MTLTSFFFFNDTATTEIYTLSLHDALPISPLVGDHGRAVGDRLLRLLELLRSRGLFPKVVLQGPPRFCVSTGVFLQMFPVRGQLLEPCVELALPRLRRLVEFLEMEFALCELAAGV